MLQPLVNHPHCICPYGPSAEESDSCVFWKHLLIYPISEKKYKRSYRLSRSLTKSLKNPSNCHSSHRDLKQLLEYQPTDTPLKTCLLKKKKLSSHTFYSKWCRLASFTFLPSSCLSSPLTPTLLPPTPGPGLQQGSVTYRDTELAYCAPLRLCIELFK